MKVLPIDKPSLLIKLVFIIVSPTLPLIPSVPKFLFDVSEKKCHELILNQLHLLIKTYIHCIRCYSLQKGNEL